MRLKRIYNLVKQSIVEHLEIPIRHDEDTFDVRITLFQSVNNRSAGLIKISLPTVQKYLDPVFYCFGDRLLDVRYLHLVTVTVADKQSGFFFVFHSP